MIRRLYSDRYNGSEYYMKHIFDIAGDVPSYEDWIKQYGAKIILEENPWSGWAIEFENEEDAIFFKLKFGL